MVKNPPAMQETLVWSLDWEDPLEKGMATYSSTLAWRIPWREEPVGLQSTGSQRDGHWACVHILERIRIKNWYLEVKCYHDSNNHHKTLKYVALDVDGVLNEEEMWSDLQRYCLALEMATHSTILAWKAPWTEKPGYLESTGLQSWTWLSDWTHTETWQHSGKLLSFTSRHSALWRSPHLWLKLSSCKLIMAPHSSTFAWKIPWTEEAGRLQSMGSLQLDTIERLHFHCSLSCIGEGNGSPLQCSCLENHRDGEAWWAAVCGVAQSRTQLKRLSSSSKLIMKKPQQHS